MMDLIFRPATAVERIYTYSQSQQIESQTGCIGHLRGDFGRTGDEFYSSWEDHRAQHKTQEFQSEFDEVVNALRAEGGCGLLQGRNRMMSFCREHPDAAFQGNYCTEYGFRLDTAQHTYLLRCNPTQGDYNFYLYAYVSKWLDHHMEQAKKGIRFIDPSYKEQFHLQDGDQIQITLPDGEKLFKVCRYIDETHLEVGSNLYHICEFAERMEKAGNTVIPFRATLPGQCLSVLPSTGEPIIIRQGEMGYTPSDLSVEGKTSRELVDLANGKIGITKAQEAAMLAGSMFGWAAPAADPKNYDENGTPIKQKQKDRGDAR